jgi:hypothetical protein
VEHSRIIIDPQTFNNHGAPGPGLGSINSGADLVSDLADEGLLDGIPNVIYRATSQAFQRYQNALEKHEKRRAGVVSKDCKLTSYFHNDKELCLI